MITKAQQLARLRDDLKPVALSGLYSDLTGRPTALSQFTNDAGFIGSSALAAYLTTSAAASTYQTISGMSSYLTASAAASTYQSISGMSSYQTVAGMSSYLTTASASSTYLTQANAASSYQPLNTNLTNIVGLAGTSGFLKKTGTNTWALDTSTYLTANQTITISGDASGSGSTSISLTLSTVTAAKGGTGQNSSAWTGLVKTAAGVWSTATAGTDYQAPIGTITGLAKGNGANALTAATAGTDYTSPSGAETLTNKAIQSRMVAIADGTSITINGDTTDIATQANTQAAGTLTINAPTGTPYNGQKLMLRLTSTNAQTFSWNAIFAGSTDLTLPTASSGSSKVDYMGFIYSSASSKWHMIAKNFGF